MGLHTKPDAGMSGNYNSVMGFDKKIFIKKFLKRRNRK
jgi:calcineurin-like phosphoesterase